MAFEFQMVWKKSRKARLPGSRNGKGKEAWAGDKSRNIQPLLRRGPWALSNSRTNIRGTREGSYTSEKFKSKTCDPLSRERVQRVSEALGSPPPPSAESEKERLCGCVGRAPEIATRSPQRPPCILVQGQRNVFWAAKRRAGGRKGPRSGNKAGSTLICWQPKAGWDWALLSRCQWG